MNKAKQISRQFRALYPLCVFFLLFFLVYSSIGIAQITPLVFNNYKHYTRANGLASTYTSDIREDKNGFLWIATAKGVSRFDGEYFTNFNAYYKDSTKHEIGYISSFEMDKAGENIWIGCDDGIFHTGIDTISFKKIDGLIPTMDIELDHTNDLFIDGRTLWAADRKAGLVKINLETNRNKKFTFSNASQKDNYKLNSLLCFVKDPVDKAVFWIGTIAGLIRFNTISKEYQVYVYHDKPELPQNKIRTIEVSNEEVFLGTWIKGLLIFNKQSKQFSQPLIQQYPNSHILILDFYSNGNSIWVTTGHGLIQYDIPSRKVAKVIEHNRPKGILKGISFIDSRGIIWYCDQKGLFKYDPLRSQNLFIELEKRSGIENPLQVRKILLSRGFIYVLGHDGTGLYKIEPNDDTFEIIKIPPFKYNIEANNLRDIVVMDNENLLILSGSRILIFDPQKKQFTLSPLQPVHLNPSLQSVVKDEVGNYWIGSRSAGLYSLDFRQNSIKNYKEGFNQFRAGNHEWIQRLYIDSKHKLWIAKGSSTVMDLDDFSIHCLDPENSVKFYQDVGGFQEDNQGRIWMAGFKDGLGFVTFEDFDNGVITKSTGYFSGVYAYNDSLLWTTGRNLGTFNINSMTTKKIELSSNNKSLEVRGPIIPDGNGKYIVGCDNGILIYNPEKQLMNRELPKAYIRKIVSAGKTIYEGNSFSVNKFDFNSGTKHLVFKISSLGFHFSDQITYQYKFGGEWQDIGPGKEINLTNLSYGDYQLNIRAFNNLGISNEIPTTYSISILTPWWARWWAYIIYLGMAILFADRFYRFQLSKRLAVAESTKLKEINQLKNSFYTNITHEFRTPLTVILGMVDSLTATFKDKQMNGAGHSLELIRRNGKNLLRLVNEMLDLSKLESGNMELQWVRADVVPFVKYLGESFHSLAEAKQINLMVYSEIDELWMDIDVNKLSAIISNVLSNAIKFNPGGGKIVIHLNRLAKNKTECFFIKIKDNGPGIPEEDINNIFNRFYQVDDSSSRRGEGTGIGLALTKEFVELMNGSIEVKSSTGKGSEFMIQLPIKNEALQTKDVHVQLEPNSILPESKENQNKQSPDDKSELPLALIIEDNNDVAHYLKTCLSGKYQSIHSVNGAIGIETAFEKVPDVIICDVMMPVKDGFEVCSELKADERTDHIPVILLTAKVTMKDKLTGLSRGADAYLTKPFVKAELLTRLDQLVLLRKKMVQKFKNDSLNHFMKIRPEDPETKFLQKIIKIIYEEINNHSFGSSVHLSHKMQLSESQIYRKLKAITGKSTAVFIRSIRLQKAKEMIQTTDKTISEIAYDVGFNDPSWFGRAFKEEFGFAPSAISK